MKTIAISIDEETLHRIDRLLASEGARLRSRSAAVRRALQEFVVRQERAEQEDRERAIIRRHRARLGRQAAALVREQSQP